MSTPIQPRSVRRSLLAVAALLVGVVGLSACETTAADFGRRVALVNASRAEVGRPALEENVALTERADAWSRTMRDDWVARGCPSSSLKELGILRHSDALALYGPVPGWTSLAENVGYHPLVNGSRDATLDTLHGRYMDSPEHRDSLLNAAYNQVAPAVVWGPTPAQTARGACPGVRSDSMAFSTEVFARI
jgi:hypothetical protein